MDSFSNHYNNNFNNIISNYDEQNKELNSQLSAPNTMINYNNTSIDSNQTSYYNNIHSSQQNSVTNTVYGLPPSSNNIQFTDSNQQRTVYSNDSSNHLYSNNTNYQNHGNNGGNALNNLLNNEHELGSIRLGGDDSHSTYSIQLDSNQLYSDLESIDSGAHIEMFNGGVADGVDSSLFGTENSNVTNLFPNQQQQQFNHNVVMENSQSIGRNAISDSQGINNTIYTNFNNPSSSHEQQSVNDVVFNDDSTHSNLVLDNVDPLGQHFTNVDNTGQASHQSAIPPNTSLAVRSQTNNNLIEEKEFGLQNCRENIIENVDDENRSNVISGGNNEETESKYQVEDKISGANKMDGQPVDDVKENDVDLDEVSENKSNVIERNEGQSVNDSSKNGVDDGESGGTSSSDATVVGDGGTPSDEIVDTPMTSIGKCVRQGCCNDAIVDVEWEDEYCSNECCVKHCSTEFKAWVAENLNPTSQIDPNAMT